MANQSKNIGHFLAFNKDWFQGHQATLLWLLNNRWTKRWARWILRIRKFDCSINDKILNLAPNSFTFNKHKKIVRVLIKRDGSFQIINHTNPISRRKLIRAGFIDERYERLEFQSTDFRTHPKYAKRIYFAFKYVWWAMHAWDMLVANQWIPEWNFGFDTLTVYPTDGTGGTTGDQTAYLNPTPDDTFANIRANAFNGMEGESTGYVKLASYLTSAKWNLLGRFGATFDTSSIGAGATISTVVLSLYSIAKTEGVGTPSIDIASWSPTVNYNFAATDFNIAYCGSVSFGNLAYADISLTSYNAVSLDANGIANINKIGISKFIWRIHWDLANDTTGLTWANSQQSGFSFKTSNYAGTDQDPKLVVTYTVVTTVDVTVSAKARIKIAGNDKTVSAKARIKLLGNDKTVTAKSRIKVLGVTKTLSAKANIIGTLSKTVSAKADIAKFGVTQTINAKARIRIADITDTVSAKARILVVNTKTISALARIKNTLTKTVSAKARIVSLVTTTISAKARIKQTLAVVLNAKARILGSLNQTISAKARIFAFPIGIILGTDNDSNLKVGVRNPVLVGLDKSTNIGVGVRLIK